MLNINKAIEDIAKGLDNLFTSDDERAQAQEKLFKIKLQIYQLEMDLQHELLKRNTEIAKQSWIGRWPEILAIIGCFALFVDLLLRPILAAYGIHFIDIDESKIVAMLMKLLGVSH